MIKHTNIKEKKLKQVRKICKQLNIDELPTHHGIEWAKLIIAEHEGMKENEANFAELMELQQALDILSKSGINYCFYLQIKENYHKRNDTEEKEKKRYSSGIKKPDM